MKKNTPRARAKRPTATLDLKATEVNKDTPPAKDKKTVSSTSKPSLDRAAKPATSSPSTSARKKTEKPAATGSATSTPGIVKENGDKANGNKTSSDKTSSDRAKSGKTDIGQTGEHQKTPPKTPSEAPASRAPSGGGGFFSHLTASLTGAVIGIFGLSYASNQNLLPPSLQPGGGAANKQVNQLAGKVRALEALTVSNNGNSLANRLTHLDKRLEKTEAGLGGDAQGSPSLAQKVARLEAVLADLEKAAKTGEGGKLAGLTAVTQQLASSTKRALALNTELIKMREAQNLFREDLTSIRSAQADFRTASAEISNELAKIRNSTAQIVANAARPPDVSSQIKPVRETLTQLTAKIEGLLSREAGSKAEGRDIALALSLGELKRAVNEGAPYKDELARVLPHAPKGLDLSALSQHANKGIITPAALRSAFSAASRKALASEHTSSSGSFLDQIVANAKSMVQVRPTGLVEGETTGAVLARMEYKLDRDDLDGALKESRALSGTARDAMRSWLAQATSRADGDKVLRALEDKIRNSLAGSSSKVKG